MNCLKRHRAWARYLNEVYRGLEAAGLDRDVFSVDDLKYLAESQVSPEQVVKRAVWMKESLHTGARP